VWLLKESMSEREQQSVNRLPVVDWAEVALYPDGHSLALGHLKNISEGGLSMEIPVCLQPGTKVRIKLSKITSGVLRHFVFTGTVVHAEAFGQGCVHGIKFLDMSEAEHLALLDYLCQVEYRYRAAS
jgi:hypothetical protein